MKKLLLLMLLLASICLSYASISWYYWFHESSRPYTEITGTPVSSLSNYVHVSDVIPLGFDFRHGNLWFSELKITTRGYISLGTNHPSYASNSCLEYDSHLVPLISPFCDDVWIGNGTVQYLLSGTAPNRVFTVQYEDITWDLSTNALINFQIRIFETGNIEFAYGPSTGLANMARATIGISMLPGGFSWFYSVVPGNPARVSNVVLNNAITTFPAEGTVYTFYRTNTTPRDLSLTVVAGTKTPIVNTANAYNLWVRNTGSQTQSTYTVQLLDGSDNVLASAPGGSITSGGFIPIQVSWTPVTYEAVSLRGRVILSNDGFPINDVSPPLDVVVVPNGISAVTIGAGDEIGWTPTDFVFRNTLYQMLLFPDELGEAGNISALKLYNDFYSHIPNIHTQIWMTNTNASDLSGGFVPAGDMVLVYDGLVDYPYGRNEIMIHLQNVFPYSGNNLLISFFRPYIDRYYYAVDQFLCQYDETFRSLLASTDNLLDPYNPPAISRFSYYPKTTIYKFPGSIGQLSGTVSDPDGTPIEGVQISFATGIYSGVTNTEGLFALNLLPATYQVSFSKLGYLTHTQTIDVYGGGSAPLSITLSQLPLVSVSGIIHASDTGAALDGATISLTGYGNYTASTNTQGQFSIAGVFGLSNYHYLIKYDGYQDTIGSFFLGDEDHDLERIVINEIANCPREVAAEPTSDNTAVTISWQEPAQIAWHSGWSDPEVSEPSIHDIKNSDKAFAGYRIWRLLPGQHDSEEEWVSLSESLLYDLDFTDTAWDTLSNRNYCWAVKAVYTAGIMSEPSFSNILQRNVIAGSIMGTVHSTFNQPMPEVSIIAGNKTATTDTLGVYKITLPPGTYTVKALKEGYLTQTFENVDVNAFQNTPANFVLSTPDNAYPIDATELSGNYPNPFNPETTIVFTVKDPSPVKLMIYNLKGQLVHTLVDEEMQPGRYKYTWDGTDSKGRSVSSGIYLYRMSAGKYSSTRKMLLVE